MPLQPLEIEALVESQRLVKSGGEWKGPCVRCGGRDRMNVTAGGLVGCRSCGDDGPGLWGAVMRSVQKTLGNGKTPYVRPVIQPNASSKFHAHPSPTKRVASTLWRGGKQADGTLAHDYLVDRRAWPPSSIGIPIPSSVRWVPVDVMLRAGCREVPSWTVGALACRYEDGQGKGTAVSLEALDEKGQKGVGENRWRRTYGSRVQAKFVAQIIDDAILAGQGADHRDGFDGFKTNIAGTWHHTVVVCEGEISALAAALKRPGSQVLASGGTSLMPRAADMAVEAAGTDKHVVIEVDGDEPGRKAAAKIKEQHDYVELLSSPEGMDVADVLRDGIERSLIENNDLDAAWASTIENNMAEGRKQALSRDSIENDSASMVR